MRPLWHLLQRVTSELVWHWRPLLLALLAVGIWMAHFDRWTLESWRIPTDYYGDTPEILARLKAASEGELWPLQPQTISRLGAPFSAHWNAYPAPDKILMLLLGGLVHLLGLYATANVGLILAQVTAALAFYLVARWLRCRWEWAAAGALLFAYSYHTFHRGLAHFSLLFTWTVPLGLAAVWLIAGSRRLAWRRPEAWLCLGAAIALGISNPYNLFFWLQLMGWALVWQGLGARRRENLQVGGAAIAVALLAFAVTNGEAWLYVENPDALPLLARNYGGTEIYALKPVEMFIPPLYHHWDWMAFFGLRYARWSPWRGEEFLPYLGIAGIIGLVWLAAVTLRRLIARRPLPGQSLNLAWVLAFASIGGLTNVVALFGGFHLFRATNRVAIFVSAIVLFFLIGRLSRLSARWPAWQRVVAAAVLAGFGVFEQLPKPPPARDQATLAADVAADREFGATLEKTLPPRAMVFQLPVVGFPEVNAPNQLGEYEHFRPYLSTSALRFSFGAPKTRSRSRWQRELEGLPTAEMVTQLERHGFVALYINRKGYADRGAAMLRELVALGYGDHLESSGGNQVAVRLRPASITAPPLAQAPTFGLGWYTRPEGGWRWAYQDATLSYYNPYAHPVTAELQFTLVGVTPRGVLVKQNGRLQRRCQAGTTPGRLVVAGLRLQPGVNRFKFSSPEAAIRLAGGRNQLRSFAIEETSVRVVVQPELKSKASVAGL